ncbi:MAG: response regulator [Chloroflexota bacterium]
MENLPKEPSILITDDEPSARATLEALLHAEGYNLFFASSGVEVLALINRIRPDVILLDVMMPGMNGFELCRQLKSEKQWRPVPIVLVTALDSKQAMIEGLDAGADDFLNKPVSGPELRARVRSMLRIKQQYDELEATLRLREDLAQMIVHDMRTPVASIMLYSELVKRYVVEPQARRYVDNVLKESHRLNAFINDLLIQAKIEAGKLRLNLSPVDLRQLVGEAIERHNPAAQLASVKLTADVPDSGRRFALDANLFQRLLDNLIENALKYSPPTSNVTVRLTYPEPITFVPAPFPLARLQVIDEGPGIPEAFRETIFGKFEVVSFQRGGGRQVGLGLTFCKLVVDAHGGHIAVTANQPAGSIFTVEI